MGRVKVYESIVKGNPVDQAGIPESFRVLIKEFQALGLNIAMINDEGKEVAIKTLEEEEDNDSTPLSIEEIDNVSMVKTEEKPASTITDEENEEDNDDSDEEDDFEAEIEDQLDELDDSTLEGSEE